MAYKKPSGISDPLQEKGFSLAAPANTATSGQFTAPSNRGNILGIQVYVSDNVLADVVGSNITIASNGVNVYENVSLAKFSTPYHNSNDEFDFFALEGSTIQVTVTNASATAMKVDVNFLFRPPHYEI